MVTVNDVRLVMAPAAGAPPAPPATAPPATTPPAELPSADTRPAAVLCAIFAGAGGQAHVVLTRRSGRLRSHTGEVSLPGGRLDPGEEPVSAALREAHEEVGIDPATVDVIGQLTPLSTGVNRAPVHPFVGILASPPQLRPNPCEVERAFSVPVVELFAEGVGSDEVWPLPGAPARTVHFFALNGDTVWGATARILRELLDRLWASLAADAQRTRG